MKADRDSIYHVFSHIFDNQVGRLFILIPSLNNSNCGNGQLTANATDGTLKTLPLKPRSKSRTAQFDASRLISTAIQMSCGRPWSRRSTKPARMILGLFGVSSEGRRFGE